MKKFFVTAFLILSLSSVSYAETSEDMSVYLRKDVFDAKMDAFMNEIRVGNERLQGELRVINARIDALNKRIDDYQTAINARIDDLQTTTSARFDDLQASTAARIDDAQASTAARFDDLKTIIYWGLSILGLLIAFAIFGPSFGEFLRNLRKPSLTIEDVKRLIEEAKLSGTPQAGVRLSV